MEPHSIGKELPLEEPTLGPSTFARKEPSGDRLQDPIVGRHRASRGSRCRRSTLLGIAAQACRSLLDTPCGSLEPGIRPDGVERGVEAEQDRVGKAALHSQVEIVQGLFLLSQCRMGRGELPVRIPSVRPRCEAPLDGFDALPDQRLPPFRGTRSDTEEPGHGLDSAELEEVSHRNCFMGLLGVAERGGRVPGQKGSERRSGQGHLRRGFVVQVGFGPCESSNGISPRDVQEDAPVASRGQLGNLGQDGVQPFLRFLGSAQDGQHRAHVGAELRDGGE